LWMTAISILNLLLLTGLILTRLVELLMNIVKQGWIVLCTLCRWVVGQKSIILMFKKLRTSVWKRVGDSPQDSTSAYSETHGELSAFEIERKAKLEKAMRAPYNAKKKIKQEEPKDGLEDRIRKAGY
jgi:hypothetical protein